MGAITRAAANNFTTSGVLLPGAINNTSVGSISSLSQVTTATAFTHIKTTTASGASAVNFVNGGSGVVFDTTYPIYVLHIINAGGTTNGVNMKLNFTDDTSSHSFDVDYLNAPWVNEHSEDDSSVARTTYSSSYDVAIGTNGVIFNINKGGINNSSDTGASGLIYFFNPGDTTYHFHFMGRINSMSEYPGSTDNNFGGYVRATAAVTGFDIRKIDGTTFNGTFSLYGIKAS